MRADELIMISVDDHLVEPPTMFEDDCRPGCRIRRRMSSGCPTEVTCGCSTGRRFPTSG